jgi:hypothetical protein
LDGFARSTSRKPLEGSTQKEEQWKYIEEINMARRRKQKTSQTDKEKIIEMRNELARKTQRGIILLLSSLIIPSIAFIFKIGESFYSAWLITFRVQIIGFLLLAILVVVISSPLIIEANSNPRTLSGPGKNPRTDLWK